MDKNFQIGFILDQEKTYKILKISHTFNKTPENFINDIIDSTYKKVKKTTLDWDEDDQ